MRGWCSHPCQTPRLVDGIDGTNGTINDEMQVDLANVTCDAPRSLPFVLRVRMWQ